MITLPDSTIWLVIALLGVGTFLIRFSFLGLIGDRELPPWVLRALRYTPVAVLPGLVAPLVLWPAATGGEPDLARLVTAGVTLVVGMITRNLVAGILSGAATFYFMLWLVG
ncbi:MAG: AzlD domain-containing protein [Pseudomonadota bacterium]|nr:AzlD domain-containing protein [Pseudomonadota bacterium]